MLDSESNTANLAPGLFFIGSSGILEIWNFQKKDSEFTTSDIQVLILVSVFYIPNLAPVLSFTRNRRRILELPEKTQNSQLLISKS